MNKRLNFNWLNFSDSYIEVIQMNDGELKLLARNVLVFDVERHEQVNKYEKLSLKFGGVARSVRYVIPYAANTQGNEFLKPIYICDIDKESKNKKRFELEGVLVEPLSWIESWVIECDRVEAFDVDDFILGVDCNQRGKYGPKRSKAGF